MKAFYFVLIILLFIVSCGENNPKKQEKQSSIISQNTSANKLYKIYKPSVVKLPDVLFVVIDAHADTELAIKHFRWSADQYGFQLIALNNVQNNDPQFEQHIQQAVKQAKQDLEINPKYLIIAGFSGGARMALNYAFNNTSQAVIMMGAGPGNQSQQFPFPLAMISGVQDFNFLEQFYPINSPQVQNTNIISLHWGGKHEWPDSSTIIDAVSFVLYSSAAINEDDIIRKPQLEKAKQAQINNNIFLYFKELELISKTSSGKLQEKTQNSIAAIQQSKKAQQYFNRFNNTITAEQKRNKIYLKYVDSKPLDWWQSDIKNIDSLIKNKKETKADSYARTKAFLGILLYSRVSAAVAGRDNAKLLPKYLSIYEMLEPKNPDLYYFKAVYAYALSNNDETIINLKKALKYGFSNDLKLQQSFPQIIISEAKKP